MGLIILLLFAFTASAQDLGIYGGVVSGPAMTWGVEVSKGYFNTGFEYTNESKRYNVYTILGKGELKESKNVITAIVQARKVSKSHHRVFISGGVFGSCVFEKSRLKTLGGVTNISNDITYDAGLRIEAGALFKICGNLSILTGIAGNVGFFGYHSGGINLGLQIEL